MRDEKTFTEQTPPAGETQARGPTTAFLVTLAGLRVGEMFRISRQLTVIGRSEEADLRLLDEGVSRRHAALVRCGDRILLKDLESANGTYRNGVRVWDPVFLEDGDKITMGGTTILKFTFQDALDERFTRQLYESAVKDGLTGLYNRRYLDDRLEAEAMYALRHRAPLTLMIVDIDHFKRVNDEHGHRVGDATLREVAQRLSSTLHGEDVIARYGGEEFAILCRGTDRERGRKLAERLRLVLAPELALTEDVSLKVTISIGIAVVPGPGVGDARELVRAADEALYEAKRQGRDRSVSFDPRTGMNKVVK